MKRVIPSAFALGLLSAISCPASASTTTCGSGAGVTIEVTVATGSPTCVASGNGTVLNTASDPFLSQILDTTQSGVNNTPALNVSFSAPVLPGFPNTDGNFSFVTTGYDGFMIGFQLNDAKLISGQPGDLENPDWFIIGLPDPAGSGLFDADALFGLLPSDAIKYAVLYGVAAGPAPSNTPLPGTIWLLGTVLAGAGAAGFKKFGKRKVSFALG
jgi:hypothetical protein